MSYIEFRNIDKSYDGKTKILENLSLNIDEGNLITLLGPSGCGKSTLLRILAGFEEVTRGSLFIGGQDVTRLPPSKRQIGMVFQQYSLFPNMNVEDNIGFGLKMKGVGKNEIKQKVERILDIMELKGKEKYMPSKLSGGQKQRVALARALVTSPKVLLLDEPLSAIDAKLRKSLQQNIREIQQKMGITTIFVTHDQDEAMIMSDMVHLINAGKIEQSGKPKDLYTNPKTLFAASFIGNYNILTPLEFKKISEKETDTSIAIRPETIEFENEKKDTEKGFFFKGVVVNRMVRGSILSYVIDVKGINLRIDELYRSFNYMEDGAEVELFVEDRNCIKLCS